MTHGQGSDASKKGAAGGDLAKLDGATAQESDKASNGAVEPDEDKSGAPRATQGVPASVGDRLTSKVLDAVIPDKVKDRPEARRKIGRIVALALSVSILLLSVFVLTRTFMQISFADLRAAITATGSDQIAIAFAATAVSFLALTGYDALALRQLRLRVPYPTTALASFTSYAISFTLGFPLITAGTVRYWIYSTKGLSGGKVASLTIIAGLTFWLGMALVLGVGFAIRASGVSHLDHLDPTINRIIGLAVIGSLGAYLAYAASGHKMKFQGFTFELPGLWLTLGQICLGLIDLCAAAGVLFVLLPSPRGIDYVTFLTVYVFGTLLGIASNAPGGIGVFEATMLKTLPANSEAELIAALLLFRVIYYLVPFVFALALLGAHESLKRWKSLRAAMEGDGDDDPEGDTVG